MKAIVYYSNSDVRVEERPKPEIGAGEILLKVEASGICGSDVMEWYRIKKAPIILGHEVAGTVEAVGDGVTAFCTGDRVTVAHHIPCNTCRYCLAGEYSVCDTLRTTNFDPGGFVEYLRVPAINVDRGTFLLPDSVSFEDGSFSEPLGCVVRSMRVCSMAPGKTVLVIGSGISGLLHIKLAKALGGGTIIATDINSYRLECASLAGADFTIRGDREDVPSVVGDILEDYGGGADIVVLCAGADSAIEQAFKSVNRGGYVMLFAPSEPEHMVPLELFDLWKNNIKVVATYASPPADTQQAIDLISSGRVTVKDLITDRISFEEAQKGFDLVSCAGESIKVVLEPHREAVK